MDADASASIVSRLTYGEPLRVNMEHDGETYAFPYRRYYLIMTINHGLARTTDCLPSNMAVNFRFHRANAECGILKIADTVTVSKVSDGSKKDLPVSFADTVIPIKNPLLHAYYAYSQELENTMAKVRTSNLEINFMGKIFCFIALERRNLNLYNF